MPPRCRSSPPTLPPSTHNILGYLSQADTTSEYSTEQCCKTRPTGEHFRPWLLLFWSLPNIAMVFRCYMFRPILRLEIQNVRVFVSRADTAPSFFLCAEPPARTFFNLPNQSPDFEFAIKSPPGLDCGYPPKRPYCKTTK